MFNGMRKSTDKIHAVGKAPKADWTQQSARLFKVNKGQGDEVKKTRRRCFRNQVVISEHLAAGIKQQCTIRECEKIRVPITRKNGEPGEKEAYVGYYEGRMVQRDGYAYGLTKNGKTPGRWYYV